MSDERHKPMTPVNHFWSTYLRDAGEEDKYLSNSWESNTGSVLTFTGLFAATVAAFIVESYKSLTPDSGDQTVMLLAQLLAATTNATVSVGPSLLDTTDGFRARTTDIIVNSLWFSSLLISLVCALLCTLIQEWSRDYVRDTNKRRTLNESRKHRAFTHAYIRIGVERYGMDSVAYCVTALIHLAVFLFVIGLAVFLFPINNTIAGVSTSVIGIFCLFYLAASLLPLIDTSSPYRTPATYVFGGCYVVLLRLQQVLMSPSARKKHRVSKPNNVSAFRDVVARTVTNYDAFLLNPSRFAFVWDRTRRHMLRENFVVLLNSLRSIVVDVAVHSDLVHTRLTLAQFAQMGSVSMILDIICADDVFTSELSEYTYYNISTRHGPDPAAFRVLTLLSLRIFLFDDGRRPFSGALRGTVASARYLDSLRNVIYIIHKDRAHPTLKLQAYLCLAIVRRLYLTACVTAQNKGTFQSLTEDYISALIAPVQADGERWHRDCNAIVGQSLDPRCLLIIMQFHVVDAMKWGLGFTSVTRRWLESRSSCWIPLHDGDCCRSWRSIFSGDGWAHDGACGMLSFIDFWFEATEDAKMDAVRLVGTLFNFASVHNWDSVEIIQGHLTRALPSAEFINLLRKVGLAEWLERTSTRDSFPPRKRDLPDEFLLRSLKVLATFIDWEAYHQSQDVDVSPSDQSSAAIPIVTPSRQLGRGSRPSTPIGRPNEFIEKAEHHSRYTPDSSAMLDLNAVWSGEEHSRASRGNDFLFIAAETIRDEPRAEAYSSNVESPHVVPSRAPAGLIDRIVGRKKGLHRRANNDREGTTTKSSSEQFV